MLVEMVVSMLRLMQAWKVQTKAQATERRGLGRWLVRDWRREERVREETRRWRREGEGSLERRRKERGRRRERRVMLKVWKECFSMRMGLR